ncbi:dihydroxyacetone kinase subunit DhaK, partial [Paenibacillus sepulcri]|nr:dihydroxyacetone kinase subunit DhaK [Paenibacillus sepulcri]
MKKLINDPENVAVEMLEGLLLAHSDQLRSVRSDNRALVRAEAPVEGKVGIATGGGSGHLPLFLGYVGKGMLDGVAVGDIFASPSSQQMLDVTRAINGGKGVLYIYGNYGGDVMNFDMAMELADLEGIQVERVVATDDVASM